MVDRSENEDIEVIGVDGCGDGYDIDAYDYGGVHVSENYRYCNW